MFGPEGFKGADQDVSKVRTSRFQRFGPGGFKEVDQEISKVRTRRF